ncbi:thiamine pyrophosphate-dependent enzyme [Micromonospora sp. M61]|uniref:thiamine pyrophosphate-dependent enzyme n=1 Tax=Micromonospora sp. M61 TaxID=2824890 RepID=UPI001B370C6E|nr:thiamine pyrophosphate-dependent enzyme [Micromonospora sp. M61]MBQ0977908.1 hypothetical protein [Micromonospora sp. M61]
MLAKHGVEHCFAVPGAPITHVADTAAEALLGFEWSVNEKVAVENALGLSFVGRRSVVMCKQNGLNVAFDPLLNAAVHSIGAAIVLIVADDLDCSRSTAMQDSRDLAEILRIPLIEPTLDGDLEHCIGTAVRLSEAESVPVILRLTGTVPTGAGGGSEPVGDTISGDRPTLDPAVAQRLTKLGRTQHRRLRQHSTNSPVPGAEPVLACAAPHDVGLICFGRSEAEVPDGACRLTLRRLGGDRNEKEITRFIEEHTRIVVLESPLPHLERRIREQVPAGHQAIGRISGHLPPEGPIRAGAVTRALAEGPAEWQTVQAKNRKDSTYPPFHPVFAAIADLRRTGVFVATDVGSSVNLCYAPYEASDAAVCLGSAVSVAGGAARGEAATVAVIGDYALLHTGLQGLLDVAVRRVPVVVVVLVNGTQDKTGGQPLAPGADRPDTADALVARLVRAVGPDLPVDRLDCAATTTAAAVAQLNSRLADAPGVVLVRASTPAHT